MPQITETPVLRPATSGRRPVWHPQIHQELLKEELYFVFLSCYGDFEDFVKAVQEALEQKCYGRYSLYYVFGNFDLIVRVWCRRDDYRVLITDLKDTGRPFSANIESFATESVTYLWSNAPAELDKAVLDSVSLSTVRAVQNGGDKVDAAALQRTSIILDFIEDRPSDRGDVVKSFSLFDFKRESNAVVDIVHEELSNALRTDFEDGGVTLYFGSGVGTLLVKQAAPNIQRFLELGDYIRKTLRLLRVRSNTYIVGKNVCESDNGDVASGSAVAGIALPEIAQQFITRYPDAKNLPEDELYVAFSLNRRAEQWGDVSAAYRTPARLIVGAFLNKDRGQLLQAINSMAEELERARKELLPAFLSRAFEGTWEAETAKLLKDELQKDKPLEQLSLGEMLQLIRHVNNSRVHDPRIDFEWHNNYERFLSIRNAVQHRPDTVGLDRIYEISLAIDGLVRVLSTLKAVAGAEPASSGLRNQ